MWRSCWHLPWASQINLCFSSGKSSGTYVCLGFLLSHSVYCAYLLKKWCPFTGTLFTIHRKSLNSNTYPKHWNLLGCDLKCKGPMFIDRKSVRFHHWWLTHLFCTIQQPVHQRIKLALEGRCTPNTRMYPAKTLSKVSEMLPMVHRQSAGSIYVWCVFGFDLLIT